MNQMVLVDDYAGPIELTVQACAPTWASRMTMQFQTENDLGERARSC